MFVPSHARLAAWHLVTQGHRNLEDSAVPTLLARATLVLPLRYMLKPRALHGGKSCSSRVMKFGVPFLRPAPGCLPPCLANLPAFSNFFIKPFVVVAHRIVPIVRAPSGFGTQSAVPHSRNCQPACTIS